MSKTICPLACAIANKEDLLLVDKTKTPVLETIKRRANRNDFAQGLVIERDDDDDYYDSDDEYGDQLVVVNGMSRKNIATGVTVRVEDTKLQSWNESSVVRELAQNLSDACIRVASLDPNRDVTRPSMRWSCKKTEHGVELRLNDKLAGEFKVYISNEDESNAGQCEVKMVIYNRGCAIPPEAFVPGS